MDRVIGKKILFYWCFGSTVYYEGKLQQYFMFQSEIYGVIDGKLLVANDSFSGSSGNHDYYKSSLYEWVSPLTIEFDVVSITNPQYMRFRIFEQDGIPAWVRNFDELNVTGACHIKINITETGSEWFVDDVSKYAPTGTVENPLRIGFAISGGSTSIELENFVIYPI